MKYECHLFINFKDTDFNCRSELEHFQKNKLVQQERTNSLEDEITAIEADKNEAIQQVGLIPVCDSISVVVR